MSSKPDPAPSQHARTAPSLPQPIEPTHAERIRTLASRGSVATLSTLSRKHEGFPFGSLMPYALDPQGDPIFLISNMAMHTQNLKADPRASLFFTQAADDGDVLGAARATLVGRATPVSPSDVPSVREIYLATHANSRYWVDFADFSFFILQPIDLYYVGGFGVMGWVPASDYHAASPDPLADAAAGILAHMNEDHIQAMILLARTHGGLNPTEVRMTSIDRLGFTLRCQTDGGVKGTRINFPVEVTTPQGTREALVNMVRQAKSPTPPSAATAS